jgi:hypothetical protein
MPTCEVPRIIFEQCCRRPVFHRPALLHDQHPVSLYDGVQPVRHSQQRAVRELLTQRFLQQQQQQQQSVTREISSSSSSSRVSPVRSAAAAAAECHP